MKEAKFTLLSPKQQALVAIATLLDGIDAGFFLDNDLQDGTLLKQAAEELTQDLPEERMPFVATVLRRAIKEM